MKKIKEGVYADNNPKENSRSHHQDIKLFSDMIDALGKVAGVRKAIINLPKANWETMCRSLDEAYRMIGYHASVSVTTTVADFIICLWMKRY
jgi:hypothetical protein